MLLKGHQDSILSINISKNNEFIISYSKDKYIHIWNFEKKSLEKKLYLQRPYRDASITENRKYIVICFFDEKISRLYYNINSLERFDQKIWVFKIGL